MTRIVIALVASDAPDAWTSFYHFIILMEAAVLVWYRLVKKISDSIKCCRTPRIGHNPKKTMIVLIFLQISIQAIVIVHH